jgi:hypothetical protein
VIAAKIRAERLLHDSAEEHGCDLMLFEPQTIMSVSRGIENFVCQIQKSVE